MSRGDSALAERIRTGLTAYEEHRLLPGIESSEARDVFVQQMVDSVHRTQFPRVIASRDISALRIDANSQLYDPIRAAVWFARNGQVDEAFWQVFLFVHFGRDKNGEWGYAKAVYGRLGGPGRWDWNSVSGDPVGFRAWLAEHGDAIKNMGAGFGNHRKYQSLKAHGTRGTGAAVETYVNWVGPARSHEELIARAVEASGNDPRTTFRLLYKSMERDVAEFGRTGAFDYLAMVGKLNLAPISPDSTYIQNSTGPTDGANLLFAGRKDAGLPRNEMDKWLLELDEYIKVGPQAIEDAVCNWQKSPKKYRYFKG